MQCRNSVSTQLGPAPCTGPGIEVEAELAQPSVDVMETSFVGPTEEAHYTHDPRPSHLHVDAFDVGPLRAVSG